MTRCLSPVLAWCLAVVWAGAAEVARFPALDAPDAWTVENPEARLLTLRAVGDWLAVDTRVDKDHPARLLLREPVEIPAGAELFWNGALSDIREILLYAVVVDANGQEILFHQESHAFCRDSMFLGGRHFRGLHRVGEVRFRTKGMKNFTRQTYTRATPGNQPLAHPLKWIGLEIREKSEKPRDTVLYFRNFAVADVNHRAPVYYQFQGQERYGDVDGPPSLSFGDLAAQWGYQDRHFRVDWTLRDRYDGQPAWSGSDELAVDFGKDAPLPVALQLARRVELPLPPPGTYWITAKVRAENAKGVVRVRENEYRLYVINGDGGTPPPAPGGADARLGTATLRIAPERAGRVWDADEPWVVNVRFPEAEDTRGQVEIKNRSGEILLEAAADATEAEAEVSVDLGELGSGIFTVVASLFRDGRLVDRAVAEVGRKERFPDGPFTPPPGVPSAREVAFGEKPRFYFDPHIGTRTPQYLDQIRAVMDAASAVTKNFEIRVEWSDIERLPGVYDWSEVDAQLEFARERGLAIQTFITFTPPEWLPSHYTQNADGEIFGHNNYLFHGARLNWMHSPGIRQAARAFVRESVLHTRNAPALESYFILIEHPGEAPYRDWYEGFDPFTLANFRSAAKRQYETIAAANRAWKTAFAGFDDLRPPVFGTPAAHRFWLDWINFRYEVIESFLHECVADLRELDPHRMVMVYGGARDRLAPYEIMTANGGCETPEKFARGLIEATDRGMPQRAEEVSVTRWAADFPTRLDTSLFSMMMGGGLNSAVKMFFPVEHFLRGGGTLDAIRGEPWALGRFEKFMPIWTELRPARTLAGDVRYFANTHSDRLWRKSTYSGGGDPWSTMFFLDSQVPFGVAPGTDWQTAKLLVLPHANLMVMENDIADELLAYVEAGGHLLMHAETGRGSVEDDAADWVLLRRFGFSPPEKLIPERYVRIAPPDASPWKGLGSVGTLRHCWVTTADRQPGQTLATGEVPTAGTCPAVTVAPFGKGKVYVVWAQSVEPPGNRDVKDFPLLRAVARDCGAALPAETSSRLVWVNMMKHKDKDIWYALVMRNARTPKETITETVKYPLLPEGEYRVAELINGDGATVDQAAETLRAEGLSVTLGPREVAIYRMVKIK